MRSCKRKEGAVICQFEVLARSWDGGERRRGAKMWRAFLSLYFSCWRAIVFAIREVMVLELLSFPCLVYPQYYYVDNLWCG